MGSGARSNGSGRRQPNRRAHCDQVKNKRCAPAGCRAEPYCFFPAGIALSEASVIPAGFFPFPPPMDEVHGFFYSFCRGSRALPMLSLFHICRPCGERESFQTRILGRVQESYGGSAPKPPVKIKKIQTRPAARVPRAIGREGKKESMGAVRPQTPNQDVGWSQWRDGSAVSFLQAANAALVRLT